jgi:hypothetical protein
MKIDAVNVFVQQRLGHWGEAILHLAAQRARNAGVASKMYAEGDRLLRVN